MPRENAAVAFLGPEGSYSHEAVIAWFGDSVKLRPEATIESCLRALHRPEIDYSVVPLENSTNGSVVFTLDLLREIFHGPGPHTHTLPDFHIIGEVYVKIEHALLGTGDGDLSKITKVYSHPQAWGQVDIWYNKHLAGTQRIDASSTSKAAELVKNDVAAAAIASRKAGELHGVPILVPNISNTNDNTTRFLVFSRAAFERETGNPSDYGTMASFVVEDGVPGALCSALKAFAKHNVNLTSIRSRPSRQELWKYIFFVEFDGTIYDDNIKQMCAELHHYCRQFSVLGSFKKCAEEALES